MPEKKKPDQNKRTTVNIQFDPNNTVAKLCNLASVNAYPDGEVIIDVLFIVTRLTGIQRS